MCNTWGEFPGNQDIDQLVYGGKKKDQKSEKVEILTADHQDNETHNEVNNAPDHKPAYGYITCNIGILDIFPDDGKKVYNSTNLEKGICKTG